jgi:hypothetical protein
MIDQLTSIGVQKGHPFTPDTATRATLSDAMQEAHAWLDGRYDAVFAGTFYDDARWALPAPPELVKRPQPDSATPTPTPSMIEASRTPGLSSAPNSWGPASSTS